MIWHEKNNLAAFAASLDLFPGYGEWGAGMEIRSDGLMSWYIGAEGWHGTYTVEDGVIHAQLTSDLEQSTQRWDFRITEENGEAELEMDYRDMTICWAYGDREDTPAMGMASQVYVDRQGTDTVYSSLHIRNSIVSSIYATLFNINHAELFAFVGRITVVFVLPYC